MENEELDNELVVSDDVPETSEQNLEEVNIGTSEDGEQVQETTEEVETPSPAFITLSRCLYLESSLLNFLS